MKKINFNFLYIYIYLTIFNFDYDDKLIKFSLTLNFNDYIFAISIYKNDNLIL